LTDLGTDVDAVAYRSQQGSGIGYLAIGRVFGGVLGLVAFVAEWIDVASQAGLVVGVFLGWIPAAIVGSLVGGLTTYLWPLIAIIVGLEILSALWK